MNDIMIDLETMGNGPNAAIVAIGAVAFDIATGDIGEHFYRAVSLQSSVDAGLQIDPSTVLWWMGQSDAARALFTDGDCISLPLALSDFRKLLHGGCFADIDQLKVWGNGAAFDNVILASAYKACCAPLPWHFWNDRCYRTIKALHPDVKLERQGTHHNALDDAISQARHLIRMIGR